MDLGSLLNGPEPTRSPLPTEPNVVVTTESGRTGLPTSLPTPSPERTLPSIDRHRKHVSAQLQYHPHSGSETELTIDTARSQKRNGAFPRSPESGLESTTSLASSLGHRSRNSSVDSTKRAALFEYQNRTNLKASGHPKIDNLDEEASDDASEDSPVKQPTSEANPAVSVPEPEAFCMFVQNCDTGSQLRKAISHLFGRNKSCTLRIPKHVWVYYCRKHYQRVRYRNAKTYPLNQMELVKLQIARLQSWSDENKASGSGPFIKLWTLSLRKREQNRIEHGEDGGEAGRGSAEAVGVPTWLLEKIGTGYTTADMMEVADRLYDEINSGNLSQIPEIEFLPDIVEPQSTGGKLNRRRKSSAQARTPKRKASEENEGPICDTKQYHAGVPHYRQHSFDGHDDPSSPTGKRARIHLYQREAPKHEQTLPSLAAAVPYADIPRRASSHARVHSIPRMQSLGYQEERSLSYPGSQAYEPPANGDYATPHDAYRGQHHYTAPVPRHYPPDHSSSFRGRFETSGRGRRPSMTREPHGEDHYDGYEAHRHTHMRSSSAYTLASKPMGHYSQQNSPRRETEYVHVPRNGARDEAPYTVSFYGPKNHGYRGSPNWERGRETLAYRPHSHAHEGHETAHNASTWVPR
ncbi:hypothetical protein VHEMI00383 [[Torrubiella] hemipterigena]|uniref:ORP1 like protein n=1 Tax=[Torrubiella] hemipterigena TaxID=1531966 RepID=A0A0A1SQB4_9HYPO|nr:hypothetical protein VHEMI00383 [[Torrubiella] hemipterigena]